MAAKKKKVEVDLVSIEKEDVVLISLMERYWKLIKTEEIGKTESVTKALDKLEEAINKRKQEIKDENS